ncbi:hypothetical protein ABEX47_04670 [Paenibacillus ehimensis]|uniref:hypothetical protein n=1 Tax=Paenibacillus ehimensis TaxID=79264 RepID=UPI000FD70AD1|nr:hypothetical protein [Paenibacillus ehimensis]
MVNIQGVLLRVLKRIPKEDAIEIIHEKTGWVPERKPKKKDDIKDRFLALAGIIAENEIEDFVQMAVMRKSLGLPAYTYKVSNLNFLNNLSDEQIVSNYSVENVAFRDIYSITTALSISDRLLAFDIRLKEYESSWLTGVNNVNSLSAVFTAKITLDRDSKVLTIYNGNHEVQEVLFDFMSQFFHWPMSSYRLKEFPNQINELGSVSFKTALLLDLVTNRLSSRGINSTFKEIKFYTGGRSKKDGIRDVAIGGRALLASQLACEYITIGSDIIFFNTDMVYNGTEFSTKVYLKGSSLDILKIVIVDTDDEEVRKESMDIIQSEYIDMCNTGIKDMEETKKLINSIAQKYLKKDQLITRAIEENTLNSIAMISNLLDKLNDQDEIVIESLRNFIKSNQTVLDSIGYDSNDENLSKLIEFAGMEELVVIDEEDYKETEEE